MEDLFGDFSYAIAFSRNHMKVKDGKSERPRFHVYFQIEEITDEKVWKRIRDKYAAEHPFCELCFECGIIVPTEEIHHKLPLSEGGTHDRSNLIALCKSCHSTIHAKRGDYWGRTMSGGHRLCADRSEAETHRG